MAEPNIPPVTTPPVVSSFPLDSTIQRARADSDRRSGWERRGLSTAENNCLNACREAGLVFMGIQKVYGLLPDGDLCLYQRERYGTTLAIPAVQVTPARLIEHMNQMEALHGTVVKKAPGNGIASLTKPVQAASA